MMNPTELTNGSKERDLFLRSLEKSDARERAAFLEGACGPDQALRQRVERLLAGFEGLGTFLEKPVVSAEAHASTAPEASRAITHRPVSEEMDERIGRYKLLQRVGEGGCGVVYVAEQEEPVRRRVALKVIKLGMDTKSVTARFEAERQALALMDHPNIARVLDAGATESGRPYFVMELVRGIKITEYCDQNNLSTRARLELFIKICRAIQHAHQKGIIHRDIKPSNILVTLHDGVPVPKVIDFGIAKATTDQRLTDKTIYTELQQFIGTPAYMSPEQAEMSGLDIDTRSDIYSLGVLLYEILVGKTPFDAKDLLASGLDEMRRTIREKEPVRPSTRLRTLLDADQSTTAQHRGIEAPKLIHLLSGDLDWIVMKALEKDRTRRYETANGLAQDIERHLKHEPVTARPPSAVYRAQKFVCRNKVMVTAAGLVASALVLGIAVSAWQAVRATLAEREQSRLRMQAEDNEQKAIAAQAKEAKQRLEARQNAYAADVKIADTAWRENNLGQATAALRRQIPKSGEADLRGIEWRYLWQKCQSQQSRIFQHEAEVACADFSPDGRWLATVSGGAFWIWDTAQEGERRVLSLGVPHDAAFALMEYLAFDPRGRFLATATSSGVLIWNVTDWRKLQSLPATNASLAFSGDGTTLAAFGKEGIQVWKTATWEPLVRPGEIPIRSGEGRRIALNRDGSLLAASWLKMYRPDADPDGEVTLWKVPQGQLLFRASEVKDPNGLVLSDDDHWLAACTLGPPAIVWLWSVPEGKLVARWPASLGLGKALAFAPGGQVLATAGSDQVIRLWEIGHTNGPPTLLQGHLNEVCSLRFAGNGRLVSSSNDKTVCLWNIEHGASNQPAFSLPSGRLICAQPADGRRMVTVNLTNLTFEKWDMETRQRLCQKSIQGADAILHHGILFNGKPLTDRFVGNSIVLDWGVQPGVGSVRLLIPIRDSGSPTWDLCATTGDGRVYAWNAESGELVCSNKVTSRLLLQAYPVADHKKWVLVEDPEGTLASYDLQTQQRELIEEHVAVSLYTLKSSPDGRLFAYVTTDGLVKVWDAATKQTESVIKLRASERSIEFSPDSRWLAVTTFGGWAQVFNADTGRPVSDPLAGYLAGIWKVSFSADSKSLVTYSWDGTAKIWNIATSREMVSGLELNWFLKFHFAWTLLPPDGNSVVESAGEGAIRVVRLPTLAEIDALENGRTKRP